MKNGISVLGFVALAVIFTNTFSGCGTKFHQIGQDEKMPLSVQVYYVYRAGGTGPPLPITSGGELSSGDHYKIIFKANRDCYVYFYQADATGKVFRLFPLKEFDGVIMNHENPVKGKAEYAIPTDDRFFYLDDAIGKEKIYCATSLQRNRDLEALEKKMGNALQAEDENQISKARQDINAYLTKRGIDAFQKTESVSVAWRSDETTSPISGYVLESLKEDSVHMIEFMHR